jgi:hypothetical protein
LNDERFLENDVLPARCFEKLSDVGLRSLVENMLMMKVAGPQEEDRGKGEIQRSDEGWVEGEYIYWMFKATLCDVDVLDAADYHADKNLLGKNWTSQKREKGTSHEKQDKSPIHIGNHKGTRTMSEWLRR